MRKYLKIAVTAEVKALVEEPWETVLLSEKLNGAELACIAFMKNDAEAMEIAEKIKAKARLEIPIVEVDAGAMNQSTAFIKKVTSKKTSPASCSTWSTLRMKNGRHLRLPDITTESSMRFIRQAPCSRTSSGSACSVPTRAIPCRSLATL